MLGYPADKMASLVATEHGLSLEEHLACQLTTELCRQHELILVMEREHIDAVSRLAPEVRGKIFLFGHWKGQLEISDPYRKSREAFEQVFIQLEQSAQQWAQMLSR